MNRQTILFLAANPSGTDYLALDREARSIQLELERSGYRDRFDFVTRWAVEPLDLLRELRRLRPTIVHYSGHGGQNGLFFQAPDGGKRIVSTAALADTFGAAGTSVKVVVLNACYSEEHADALLAHVGCVLGMSGPIKDEAAKNFAIGFYGGLGENESVATAFMQGKAAISLEAPIGALQRDVESLDPEPSPSGGESERPQLKVRPGVDAERLRLVTDPS